MKVKHPKGTDSPQITGIRGVFKAEPDEDGYFTVGKSVSVDTLKEHGYEIAEHTSEDEPESESEEPDLSGFTEEDIVMMDYRELQQIAGDFEDIKGNASEGEIEEALINKLR